MMTLLMGVHSPVDVMEHIRKRCRCPEARSRIEHKMRRLRVMFGAMDLLSTVARAMPRDEMDACVRDALVHLCPEVSPTCLSVLVNG